MATDTYFTRTGPGEVMPTHWTAGAWRETEQHFAPLGGLLVHEVERFVAARGADELVIGRIAFEILGVVPLEAMQVTVEVVRGGRTIELLEATLTCRGRAAVRARVWRVVSIDTSAVAGGAVERATDPAEFPQREMQPEWPGDFIRSIDVRAERTPEPGRGFVWVTTGVRLIDDADVSALATYVMLIDTANGIAVRASPSAWMFPNVDLAIHLHRQPRGAWVGLDTTVVFGAGGLGVTSSELHDVHGAIGRAEQLLTVRPLG
jgi:hypothetical protein